MPIRNRTQLHWLTTTLIFLRLVVTRILFSQLLSISVRMIYGGENHGMMLINLADTWRWTSMVHVQATLQLVPGFVPLNVISAVVDTKVYYYLGLTINNALGVAPSMFVLDTSTGNIPSFEELQTTGDVPTAIGATCVSWPYLIALI